MTATSTKVLAACCGPAAPIAPADAQAMASLLKAVADPARLQIITILRRAADQSACVCDITAVLGLSQPTVSHHLKVLTEAGIVTREARGTWAWFTLVPQRLAQIRDFLA